jgi:phage-related protein
MHAFDKATQKTPIRDLNLGRQRFRDLVAMREARDAKRHT